MLTELLDRQRDPGPDGTRDAAFAAEQNARAADGWGEATREMPVPPARSGSTEALLHQELDDPVLATSLFVSDDPSPWAVGERAHRAIGVVYHPEEERWGNYVPTVLGRRYDAFVWCDETTALRPLGDVRAHGDERETWSFG